jgi:lipid-A-disaccharide synthase
MARYLDLMLCIFPFEAELYNQSGLRTIFVGHPMLEALNARRMKVSRDPDLIGLFPGSRIREIRKILPTMIGAAERIAATQPNARFEIAAASERLAAEIKTMLRASKLKAASTSVTVNEAAVAMQRAGVGIVASGTATLEAAVFRMPFVLVYKMAWLTYVAALILVKVKHVGMPNVLAGKEIVPEFIQHRATPAAVGDAVTRLLEDARARDEMVGEFDGVIAQLGEGAASEQAARVVLDALGS